MPPPTLNSEEPVIVACKFSWFSPLDNELRKYSFNYKPAVQMERRAYLLLTFNQLTASQTNRIVRVPLQSAYTRPCTPNQAY